MGFGFHHQQTGAVVSVLAHNPKVPGSKPGSATIFSKFLTISAMFSGNGGKLAAVAVFVRGHS